MPELVVGVGGLGRDLQHDEGDDGGDEVDHGLGGVGEQTHGAGQPGRGPLERDRGQCGTDGQPRVAAQVLGGGVAGGHAPIMARSAAP